MYLFVDLPIEHGYTLRQQCLRSPSVARPVFPEFGTGWQRTNECYCPCAAIGERSLFASLGFPVHSVDTNTVRATLHLPCKLLFAQLPSQPVTQFFQASLSHNSWVALHSTSEHCAGKSNFQYSQIRTKSHLNSRNIGGVKTCNRPLFSFVYISSHRLG